MRAIGIRKQGGSEVLELLEIPAPETVSYGEVIIRVVAAVRCTSVQ